MSQENHNTEKSKRKHLNRAERETIERMYRAGASKGEIARALLRNKSTIKREIQRGTVKQRKRNPYQGKGLEHQEFIEYKIYAAEAGQRVYEARRQNSGSRNKVVKCAKMVKYVEERIQSPEKWPPDMAIGYAKAQGLFSETFTTKTFYNWVEDGLVKVKNMDLLLKVRRKPRRARRERKKILGKSIDERPAEVKTREEFGHWEGDGIVGRKQQGHLITLVERKTRMGLLFNVKDKESQRIVEVMDSLESRFASLSPEVFKTLTFDNGSEFAASEALEKGGRTRVYYAHPYSSYERGTNENWNGIVRRFIPKGSSFEGLTQDDMVRISHYINTMPRKRFGYKTPLQMREEEISRIMAA